MLFLLGCGFFTQKPPIKPNDIEYGPRGVVPTIHENYDWICADSNAYRMIAK